MDLGKQCCAIVSLHVDGADPAHLVKQLRQANINTSYTNRGSAVIDFERKQVNWVLRISPHYYNERAEIDRCLNLLASIQG